MRDSRVADWLPLPEALARVLAGVAALPAESTPLEDAPGRVLGEDAVAPVDHPPWDSSAMDGIAVRSSDIRGATAAAPVLLHVVEAVPAGGFPERSVGAGEAIRVMTGAPIPEGADGVVRIEHTRPDGERIAVLDDSDAGRNIRDRGEDVRAGSTVLRAGRRLSPADIGVLASLGAQRIVVHRQPRAAILATGDELADPHDYALVRSGRRIANSNGPALAAAVRATGAIPVPLGVAADRLEDIVARVQPGLDADVLITTAGASVGDHDVVKEALESLGMATDFWRVRMKPGSPFSFGRIPRQGAAPLLVFGLPGYPVSALVTFRILAAPVLRALGGRADVHDPVVSVRAAARIPSTAALTHFLRVRLERVPGEPLPLATLTGPQGSGILTSLAHADALLIVPEGADAIEKDTVADAVLLAAHDGGSRHPPVAAND
jgi:molybdopterin molybdotransferase